MIELIRWFVKDTAAFILEDERKTLQSGGSVPYWLQIFTRLVLVAMVFFIAACVPIAAALMLYALPPIRPIAFGGGALFFIALILARWAKGGAS